jgi:hypothetical protein
VQSKGANLDDLRAFVELRFGRAGWERVVASLPVEDRPRAHAPIAIAWYEVSLHARLLRAVDELLGKGDGALAAEFGRFDAERDLHGAQRLFLRLANPAYVLEKAGEYWHRFYDTGSWHLVREPDGVIGTLVDFHPGDPLFCVPITQYIGRMFELVGARDVRVQHPKCTSRGDDTCVFIARWRR